MNPNSHRGLCQCGCGDPAPLAIQTDPRRGNVKGEPQKYILGHTVRGRKGKKCYQFKHGEAGKKHTPEYSSWSGMLGRCYNPNNHKYEIYGGRGITVCKRWRADFRNFLADMGRKSSPDLSLDRKNVNGDYSKRNCRWATRSQQQQNRRPYKMGVLRNFSNSEIQYECERRGLH